MFGPFSEYVPLGWNCEVAFQLRRVLGQDIASFFSWNITPLHALESLLASRFDGILKDENLSPHGSALINDHSHDFKFHSPFASVDFRADPDYAAKLEDHRRKARHLIDKLYRPRGPEERTAYFYKVETVEDLSAMRSQLVRIRELLAALHPGGSFALVVMLDQRHAEPPWGEPHIHNRYLKRLAPVDDATDGHVSSYDKIFREFPYAGPMRLANY